MAGTYSQIYIQIVFAVKGRQNLLLEPWRQDVFKYMTGIVMGKNQKPLVINGVSDHVHLFVGLNTSFVLSDLVRDIKNNTSNYINARQFLTKRFSWQEGFGAFSYGRSQIGRVCRYIENQEKHHRKQTFKNEYTGLLNRFGIPFQEKHLFDWIDLSSTPVG